MNDCGKRGIVQGRVISNVGICTDHYRLTLEVPGFSSSVPGQFVQLDCAAAFSEDSSPHEMEWGTGSGPDQRWTPQPEFASEGAYLRRPFSIARHWANETGVPRIDVIHRVVGRGTRYLAGLKAGDEVSVLGPLGKGFWFPDEMDEALLVGGGVGIPPMLYLAEMVARAGKHGVGFVGAQRRDLVPLTFPNGSAEPNTDGSPVMNATEFAQHGVPTVLTTDDGSWGMKGYVTGALDKYLARSGPAGKIVFCCGPTPMMKATAKVAKTHGVKCLVSLEQPMACGMGTCQSCVVKVNSCDDWVYKLTCTDGPVFETGALRGF